MQYYPINYKIFGKGKSFVLFLHGWGGSTNSFLSVANKLSKDHKVIVVDFYGFGESEFPKVPLDCYDYAVQLYLLLKKHNISELSIVGHSFGGRIAIILSSIFNLKINKIVLVDSAGLKPKRSILYKVKVLRYKLYKNLVKHKIIKLDRLSKFGSDEYKQLSDLQKISYVKIVNQDLLFLLKYIKSRTLLVWGDNDKTTPMYMARRFQNNLQNCSLYVYEDSGHFAYLENYINFCNLLIAYLKGS